MNTFGPSSWARWRALVLIALALLFPAALTFAQPACPSAPAEQPIMLPHFHAALLHDLEGIIVTLGSSSTRGAMASDIAHAYPAVLQQVLSAGLADSHIAVINRGISGQDAPEELARIDRDVLAIRPQLVIWQVGANGALRKSDPEAFRQMVTEGVQRIQAAGADVVLMDNQQTPRLLAMADESVFDQTLAQVAKETGTALFSRRALMRTWQRHGVELADFIAPDGLHHNDRGYFCVAQALARSILAGLTPSQPLTASR
jgi:acyl-CoA thioesterase-1